RLRCAAALITRGEHGMTLFEPGRRPLHIPTAAREVFDVTGAGDTVIATIGLARCAGASLPEAARLANLAAGVVVGKVGTATASPGGGGGGGGAAGGPAAPRGGGGGGGGPGGAPPRRGLGPGGRARLVLGRPPPAGEAGRGGPQGKGAAPPARRSRRRSAP